MRFDDLDFPQARRVVTNTIWMLARKAPMIADFLFRHLDKSS
jgi:hypothetical protein